MHLPPVIVILCYVNLAGTGLLIWALAVYVIRQMKRK